MAYQKCDAFSLLRKWRRNGITMKTRCVQDTHFIMKFRFDTLAQRIDQVCVKRNVQFKTVFVKSSEFAPKSQTVDETIAKH